MKKIIAIISLAMVFSLIFTGCSLPDKVNIGKNTNKIENLSEEEREFLPDVVSEKNNYGFNIPISLYSSSGNETGVSKMLKSMVLRNGMDTEDNFYYIKPDKSMILGTSRYYTDDSIKVDAQRVNLDEIKSSEDVIEKLTYKLQYIYSIATENKMGYILEFDIKSEKEVIVENKHTEKFKENIKASYFSGTGKLDNEKTVKIYGYSIMDDKIPVIIYVIDTTGKISKANCDELLKEIISEYTNNAAKYAVETCKIAEKTEESTSRNLFRK